MSEFLFSAGDYVRFTQHDAPEVRQWALGRLEKRHPELAKERAVALLDDADMFVAEAAADVLANLNATECAPALLEKFQPTGDRRHLRFVQALGRLRHEPLLPVIQNALAQEDVALCAPMKMEMIYAVGELDHPDAQKLLLQSLQNERRNSIAAAACLQGLCHHLTPALLRLAVEHYLSLPAPKDENVVLTEFALMTFTQPLMEGLTDMLDEEEEDNVWTMVREDYGIDAETVLPESLRAELVARLKEWDVAGAARWVADHLTHLAQQQGTPLEWTHEQFESMREDRKCAAARLALTRAFAGLAPQHPRPEEVVTEELAFLVACLLKTAGATDFDALIANASDPKEGLLQVLALNYDDVPHEFIHRCAAWGAAVVPDLCRMLEDPSCPTANRAAEVLKVMAKERPEAVVPAIPALLAGLKREYEEVTTEFCEDALRAVGEPVLDHAPAVLQGDHVLQKLSFLGVLEELPVQRTVQVILEHLEPLLIDCDEATANVLRTLGARDAIEPLSQEWREGEIEFEDALVFLCRLHNVHVPELEGMKERYDAIMKRRRLTAQLESPDQSTFADLFSQEGLSLRLRCGKCRRTYRYQVGTVYGVPRLLDEQDTLDEQDEEAFFFLRKIICKKCGAVDEYEITVEAHIAVSFEMVKLNLMEDADMEREEFSGVEAMGTKNFKLVHFALSDGTPCTPRQAVRIYQERLAQSPQDSSLWVRLGNVYMKWQHVDEAKRAFEQAVALNPNNVEAHLSLGTIAYDERNKEKAKRHLETVRRLTRTSLNPRHRDMADAAAWMLEDLGLKSPLIATPRFPPVVQRPRIGRNAPCPCGSGKKYKNCCMRREL